MSDSEAAAEAEVAAEPELAGETDVQGEPQRPEAEQDGVSEAEVAPEPAGEAGAEPELSAAPEPSAEQERSSEPPPVLEQERSSEPPEPLEEQQLLALSRVVEALLFLSPDPVSRADLAEAVASPEEHVAQALALLEEQLAPGLRGLHLREIGEGYVLASSPEAEEAARRLFSRPRVATLTPAQTETLAIVAYLQPISRPEIGRIRGVSADSATAALLERGLIEESGRSQFGAALYKTTTTFLKLFGLRSLQELPDVAQWDPSPEEQAELRDRLLRAGEARAGGGPSGE